MKFEVKIPAVGESINEVTIGQWLKNDGDYVEMDEILCEIESEKATLEIRSERDGVLKILAQEGETHSIGDKIAEINTEATKPVETGQEEKPPEPEKTSEGKPEPTAPAEETLPVTEDQSEEEKEAKVSPLASRLMSEAGLNARQVEGTGPGGRITKSDVEKAIKSSASRKSIDSQKAEQKLSPGKKPGAQPEKEQLPVSPKAVSGERNERRIKMSTLRKTIARRLVAAKNETAMLTTFNELDMSAVIEVRNRYKELFQKKYEIKLGFMSFFIRAACIALKEFPEVNARIDEDEVVYHDFCDISLAVSTPKGLVVPVIFDADQLTLPEIEARVAYLAEKARDNKLTIDEMTGGTFSITNGGVFGSLLSTPIINAPQTAILGMHKIEERPVALNGEVVIRPMMYVALSYDHRIIDGKESVSYLVRIKELIEDPTRMLLDV